MTARRLVWKVVRSAATWCRWFDVVPLTRDLDMWVDNEGAIQVDAEVNLTAIARAHGAIWRPFCDAVVPGAPAHDGTGAVVGLSDAQK
ncbi:hypothetical protein P3H15_42565 [Rhodococcus sp. T2V]|nr:hypothetical protein [Rhodococcus sp. T2V]